MTREEALEILGLEPDASLDEAKKAYRTLVKYYHPDRNAASNATAMFRIISDAWEFIQNATGQEYAEAEAKRKQAEAEVARRRAEEDAARRRAETEAQRKRSEGARQAEAAQTENISKPKEDVVEKYIKRFCYLAWLIVFAIYVVPRALSAGESIFKVFLVACIGCLFYGWITVWVITKIRRWFK